LCGEAKGGTKSKKIKGVSKRGKKVGLRPVGREKYEIKGRGSVSCQEHPPSVERGLIDNRMIQGGASKKVEEEKEKRKTRLKKTSQNPKQGDCHIQEPKKKGSPTGGVRRW